MCRSLALTAFIFFHSVCFSQKYNESEYLDSLSFAQFENNEFSEAEKNAQKLLTLNLIDTNIYRINANTLLGIINKNRGYYISSTEHYLSALNDARNINDTARQSAILNNLGTLYKLQYNNTSAIDYFKKSLALEKSLNNSEQKSIRYYNIADTYLAIDSLDLALSFFNNSLLLEQKINNKTGLLYAYLGITNVYIKMNNQFQSNLMIEKIKKLLPVDNVELKILFDFAIAKYFVIARDSENALVKVDLAIQLAELNKMEYLLPELLELRLSILKQLESWRELSTTYEDYFEVSEKLNSQMIRNEIYDLNYQNELNRKQLEVESLISQKRSAVQAQAKESKMRQFQERLLIFILGLLLVSIVFVFLGVRKIKRVNP
jgi:hypothetical protein